MWAHRAATMHEQITTASQPHQERAFAQIKTKIQACMQTQQNTTTSTHTCPDCDDTHPLGQEKNVDQPFPTGPFQAHST